MPRESRGSARRPAVHDAGDAAVGVHPASPGHAVPAGPDGGDGRGGRHGGSDVLSTAADPRLAAASGSESGAAGEHGERAARGYDRRLLHARHRGQSEEG